MVLCGEPAPRLRFSAKVMVGVTCLRFLRLLSHPLASLLATAAIASCFEVRGPSKSLSHVATGAGHAGHPEVVLQLLEVLAPLRVLSFPGWGTTICDVATLEHTISFGSKGMPPLFVQALHTRDAPDLGAWYPLIVGLALCSPVTERVPFWYLRRRLQTGPHSGFRVPLGGGLPGWCRSVFRCQIALKHASPSSPTWGLSPVLAGGSSQEPQPNAGSALILSTRMHRTSKMPCCRFLCLQLQAVPWDARKPLRPRASRLTLGR